MPLSALKWFEVPMRGSLVRASLLRALVRAVGLATVTAGVAMLSSCTTAKTPVVIASGATTQPASATPIANADFRGPVEANARIVYITDGDTVLVELLGPLPEADMSGADAVAGSEADQASKERMSIRLIGIDTPESKRPNAAVECFAHESSAALAALAPVGTRVRIELDVEQRDRYGRLLGYVFRASDGLFLNHEMVRAGMAAALTLPPNITYGDQFAAAATAAREHRVGLWSKCESEHEPARTAHKTS